MTHNVPAVWKVADCGRFPVKLHESWSGLQPLNNVMSRQFFIPLVMHWRFLSVRSFLSNCTFILKLSFLSFCFLSVSPVCWRVLIFLLSVGEKIWNSSLGLDLQALWKSFGLSVGSWGIAYVLAFRVGYFFFVLDFFRSCLLFNKYLILFRHQQYF